MLETIFSQFQTQGTIESAKSYGSGHINDTYLVRTHEKDCHDYILQRINHRVFTNPLALMNNILLVTQHIRNKLHSTTTKECLTVICNLDQQPIVIDNDGNFWACYLYIEDSYTHDIVKNTKQAYEGGKLIGRFLGLLHDFPSSLLHETIPQFHSVEFRLSQFETAIRQDVLHSVHDCQQEIEFVRHYGEEMQLVMQLGKQGKIPLRVVHNDTKFNNILLDSDDNGLCIIDLDTVMPGYVHYDFSDAVRTIANSSAEDEKDLSTIHFDMALFKEFCHGFFAELRGSLNQYELDSLARAVPLMPFLHGTRFLTDHLSGDHYYKIHFAGHNLQRARAQFQLIRRMQENMPKMQSVIQEICSNFQPALAVCDH